MRRDDDQTIERLLAGSGDDDVLTATLAELRALGHAPIAGLQADRHVAAAARAAHASNADTGVVIAFRPSRRPSPARQLVAVAAALFVLVFGLSAAGALPDPIQSGLASLVRPLGIHLPDPDHPDRGDNRDGHDGPGGAPVETPDPSTPPTSVPGPPDGRPGPPETGPPAPPTTGPPSGIPTGPPPGTPTGPPEAPGPPG